MKKMVVMAGIVALVGVGCCELSQASNALPQPVKSVHDLNRVIATVNGDPITQHQFDAFYTQAVQRLKEQNQALPEQGQLRRYLLNQLIDQRLQIQMANRGGIHVSDDQVEQQIKLIMKQKNMTLAQLKQYLQERGYSFATFQNEVKNEMLVGQLQHSALANQVSISQNDVAAEYKKIQQDPRFSAQYHIIDMLIPLPEKPTTAQVAQALKSAQELKAQLQKGMPYSTLATNNKTDLGWRTLSQLPTLFADNVVSLKAGGVAGPLRAANGVHVLQVIALRKSTTPLPSLREVQEHIYMIKIQSKMADWLKNLRKQSDIQIYDQPAS